MYSIEPHSETIIKRSITVTLDEDEITRILVDAAPFQKELRKIRAQWHGPSGWATDGLSHARKNGKQPHAEAAQKKVRGGSKLQRCPKCHKDCKRVAMHLRTCTGNRDPLASAQAASVLDE